MAATETTAYRIDVADAVAVWDQAGGPTSAPFDLVPAQVIQRYGATHARPLQRTLLPDWTAFEYGHIDWDHHDFARLLGLDDIPADTPLILVTDEGLRDGCAFRFQCTEFPAFVRWYEDSYHMGFFQSADYIMFDERLAHVRILHHEGAVFRN
jgi:hypothetical protein